MAAKAQDAKRKREEEAALAKRARTLGRAPKTDVKSPEEKDTRKLLDFKPGELPQILTMSVSEFAKLRPDDLLSPILVRPCIGMEKLTSSDTEFRKELSSNQQIFKQDAHREKGLKRVIQDQSVRAMAKATLQRCLHSDVSSGLVDWSTTGMEPDAAGSLSEICDPDFWMRAASSEGGGTELVSLPCFR